MRIRIVQKPSVACIDGVQLDQFEPGQQYEVGNIFGALLLAEGWAEPVDDPAPALVIPLSELEPEAAEPLPANLIRESIPPYYHEPRALALDRRRRQRNRPAS